MTRGPYLKWTTSKLRQLREMYGAGESLAAIATVLGGSERAVRSRLHDLGLARRHGPYWTARIVLRRLAREQEASL